MADVITTDITGTKFRLVPGNTLINTQAEIANLKSDINTAFDNATAAGAVTLETAATATTGYLKTYEIYQGVLAGDTAAQKATKLVGKVDIPKDLLAIKGEITNKDGENNPGTFIKLTIGYDGEETAQQVVYIDVASLIEYNSVANTAEIALSQDANHQITATVVKIDGSKIELTKKDGSTTITAQAAYAAMNSTTTASSAAKDTTTVDNGISVVTTVTQVDGVVSTSTAKADKYGSAEKALTDANAYTDSSIDALAGSATSTALAAASGTGSANVVPVVTGVTVTTADGEVSGVTVTSTDVATSAAVAAAKSELTGTNTDTYETKTIEGTRKYAEKLANEATTQYFEGTRADGETDAEVITRVTEGTTVKGGSTFVIKTAIGSTGKYQYTAFTYDVTTNPNSPQWRAMDGNYDWNNVIAAEDITVTKAVGTITIPSSGSTTFATAGKSVKQVFEKLLAQEQYPTVTHPSVSLTSKKDGSNYTANTTVEAGTSVTIGYTTSLNAGSYTYGPATGVTASSYSVALKKGSTAVETKTTSSDTFTAVTIKDGEVYSITSTISHTAGATPLTNLGSDATTTIDDCLGTKISGTGTDSSNPISATSKSATSSTITGYNMGVWYGTSTSVIAASAVTSANVRALSKKNNATTSTGTFTMTVPVGAKTIIIAAKGTRTLTQVLNTTVNADMTNSFVKNASVSVCGADAPSTDNATNYTVWTYSPAEAYGSTAALTIKIA